MTQDFGLCYLAFGLSKYYLYRVSKVLRDKQAILISKIDVENIQVI